MSLSMSRPATGFGPGAIPYSEMVAYMDENLIMDEDDREDFILAIQRMDLEFLKQAAEKAKRRK